MKTLLLICLTTSVWGVVHTKNSQELWTATYIKAINGFWGFGESASGPGSTAAQTADIRTALEYILKSYSITSVVDLPCGDFNWMKLVNLKDYFYMGCDIVKPLIENNIKQYGDKNRKFVHLDAVEDKIPYGDLIISRDFFVHLSLSDIKKALHNIKKSGARYLLTTTFFHMRADTNTDIITGGWRTINLQKAPFNFPAPLHIVNEGCTEQNGLYADKSLALYRIEDIPLHY